MIEGKGAELVAEEGACAYEGRGNGELELTAQWGASSFVHSTKYSGEEIEGNKMGEVCGTHGGEEKIIWYFGGDS
jgi:hypothetical protein